MEKRSFGCELDTYNMDKLSIYRTVESLVQSVIKFRRIVFAVIGLLVVFVFFSLPKLKVDNSISSWFAADDPALIKYNNFLRTFGNDDVIVNCVYDSLPYYHPDRIASTRRLTEAIKSINGVSYVSSYINFPFRYLPNGYQSLEGLNHLPEPELIHDWIENTPMKNRLVGSSPEYVLLYAWPDTVELIDQGRNRVVAAIDSIFATDFKTPHNRLHKGGLGVVYDGINQSTLTEGSLFLGLSYLLLIVSMILISRSYFITILAIATITCATIFLLGAMILLGKPINTVTLALPPLIMVIGVSNLVHFTLHTRNKVGKAFTSKAVILSAVTLVAIPILFNMMTTAGGFLSLTSSSVGITRDYGLLAALSIFFVSLLACIAIIIYHQRLFKIDISQNITRPISHWASSAMQWSMNHHKTVIIAGILLVVLSIAGMLRLKVDTEPLGFIPRQHTVRKDHDVITREIGDYISMEFVMRFKKSSWKTKKNLALLQEVQVLVGKDPLVSNTLSIQDFVKDTYQRTPGHKLRTGQDFSHAQSTKLSLLSANLLEDPFIQRLSTQRGDVVRIVASIPFTTADNFKEIYERITQQVMMLYGDRIEFYPSGYLPLYAAIVDTVLTDQIKSVLIAIVVIFFLIYLVLRSTRLSLLALPSNLVPVLIILGLMGWTGVPLDISSVTLAATILGIIVDDSLHMLFTYKNLLSKGLDVKQATSEVAKLTGSAVFSTSLILALGYSILAISSVPILSVTGILMMTAVLAALLADLFLLPALVRVVY